ncbi:MAG: hypothetical protein J5791_07480, partial [Fibrobacter sp.]|nr:hypothetical protein [Fibrobacter sp.]
EIFAAFGIDNSGFKGFAEDYNILEEGDGNAALLAISALLQGDRNESQLTAVLAALSVDLGDNGVWDNKQQRAEIADWAMKKELDGGLPSIRANIKGWKLREGEPPAFEGHFRNFWMQELGVGECTKDNAGALFAIKNANSEFYAAKDSVFTENDRSLVRLICDASGETPAWRYATDIEKDTAALPADAVKGAVANGKIDTGFVYVKDGEWRRGTDLDMALDFSCIEDVKNYTTYTAEATDTTWYICVTDGSKLGGYTIPTSWRLAKEAEADTAQFGIPKTAADSIKQGHINKGRIYVYEENGWRRGTENDYLFKKACLYTMKGEVIKTSANQYYTCTDEEKILSDGATVNSTWRISTAEEADYYFAEKPDQEGAVRQGDMDKSRVYVFEKGEWRRGTNLDLTLIEGCIRSKVGTIKLHEDKYYTCTAEKAFENGIEIANTWRLSNADEADTLDWSVPTSTKDSVKLGNIDKSHVYVYENNVWRRGTAEDAIEGLGACTKKKLGTVHQATSTVGTKNGYYRCSNDKPVTIEGIQIANAWREATDFEKDSVGWSANIPTTDAVRAGAVNDDIYYVYDISAKKWRRGTSLDNDSKLGPCTKAKINTVASDNNGVSYKCVANNTKDVEVQPYSWRAATNLEVNTWSLSCTTAGYIHRGLVNSNEFFTCINVTDKTWREATTTELDTLGFSKVTGPYKKSRVSKQWYKNGVIVSSAEQDFITSIATYIPKINEVDTVRILAGKDYDIKTTDGKLIYGYVHNTQTYSYDSLQTKWQALTTDQATLARSLEVGCTKNNARLGYDKDGTGYIYPKGLVKKNSNGTWYVCKYDNDNGEYAWTTASEARWQTYGNACYTNDERAAYQGFQANTDIYAYVCDADTFRTLTVSEQWALNNTVFASFPNTKVRCSKDDENVTVIAKNVQTTFVCKNGLYVWNGKSKFFGKFPLEINETDYFWDGKAVGINNLIWTAENIDLEPKDDDIDPTTSEGPYRAAYVENGKTKSGGLFFNRTLGEQFCAKITNNQSWESFHLPTYDEWNQLIKEDVPETQELKSTQEWQFFPGTNISFFGMLPTGYTGGYESNYLYYINASGDTTQVLNLRNIKSTTAFIAAPGEKLDCNLQYNESDGFSHKSPSSLAWGALRCVSIGVPAPPTSN